MEKKKRNKPDVRIEPLTISWLDTLFNPTIEMAAELMNVTVDIVDEWLAQEHLATEENNRLSNAAIDFLARKYASRLHKYFNNCLASWDTLDDKDKGLFSQFKRKYGKLYHLWRNEWSDIDERRIIKDFKAELKKKVQEKFFDDLDGDRFEPYEFPSIVVKRRNKGVTYPAYFFIDETKERSDFLFSISHSLYYGSRIHTKIQAKPEHRDIVLEILQENRFHIFTGESDGNEQIDAISSSVKVNQPQLAIASVFGYQQHKNLFSNEITNKIQTY